MGEAEGIAERACKQGQPSSITRLLLNSMRICKRGLLVSLPWRLTSFNGPGWMGKSDADGFKELHLLGDVTVSVNRIQMHELWQVCSLEFYT